VAGLPDSIVAPLVQVVAELAGVTPDAVTVVSAEPMTFPNGGLGCEQPGMQYIQVQVDGYRVVLEARSMTYDYRGTWTSRPRRCLAAIG
jgi:hypothetical protein